MIDNKKSNINLRKMEFSDLNQVVKVHLQAFQNFFLSSLGAKFLYLLYEYILIDPSGISLVAEADGDGIIGFVTGTTQPKGFYSRAIKKRAFLFAMASLPALIKSPIIITRLLGAFKKPQETYEIFADCELMSIAILPSYAGKGIGKSLELEFCKEAIKRNMKSVYLTTDQENNEIANSFYIKQGYIIKKIIVKYNTRFMNLYYKKLI